MAMTRRNLLRSGIGAGAALAVGGPADPGSGRRARPSGPRRLRRGFRSLTEEIRLPNVPVEGRIPAWLQGILLRNGPALFEIGEQKLNHWFDGLAMLHGFSFSDGRVSYANRFLRSSAYRAWRRDGVMEFSEFGTDPEPDPCRAMFSGVSTLPVLGPIPNANVSIEQLAKRFQAHTEIPIPVRFDPRQPEDARRRGRGAERAARHGPSPSRPADGGAVQLRDRADPAERAADHRRAPRRSPRVGVHPPGPARLPAFVRADAPLRRRPHPALGVRPGPLPLARPRADRDQLRLGRDAALASSS